MTVMLSAVVLIPRTGGCARFGKCLSPNFRGGCAGSYPNWRRVCERNMMIVEVWQSVDRNGVVNGERMRQDVVQS